MPGLPDQSGRESVLQELLVSTPTSTLAGLDFDVRWDNTWCHDAREAFSVDDAQLVIDEAIDAVTAAAGLSMHRNGRIREVAVRTLWREDDPRVLRWLLLRCGVGYLRSGRLPWTASTIG